ncbi:MAG: type IV secretion system DNA-binding domain-containing protein [Bryobacteraceae bacterium]
MVTAERAKPGRWGAFPIRFPIAKVGAILAALILLPAWWKVGVWRRPVLQQLYLKTYVRTAYDSVSFFSHGHVGKKQYAAVVAGAIVNPILLSEDAFKAHPEMARVQLITVHPPAFHRWLQERIYGGAITNTFGLFIILLSSTFALLFMGGVELDRRRYRSGQRGVHVRGTAMVSWRRFNRKARKPTGITLRCGRWPWQKLRIAEELLAYHLATFGATGRGKSTIFREVLHQVQARGETAVIYDPKGEFRDEFYSVERGDVILDPTDERCPYWELEGEAKDEAQATPWAQAFWPDEPRQQPFFKRHPRAIMAYLLSRYSAFNEPELPATCAALGYWLSMPVEKEILPRLRGTEHADSLKRSSDQSQGLKSTLGEIAKPLRMMPATPEGREKFSVREWSRKRQGWIFMTSTPLTADALLPLQSAMLDMLILSTQNPAERGVKLPKIWFVLDEVASLQKLPQLEGGMTKQRASGGTLILGIHDHAQMKKRYGEEGSTTVMAQAGTNIFLQTEDGTAARYVEQFIGHEEIERIQENRPVHIETKHRSRSWTNQTVDSPVVTASEIQALPRFSGYVKQEGKVVQIQVQKLARHVKTKRLERIIPPLIFRDEPEPNPAAEHVVPVDDEVRSNSGAIRSARTDDDVPSGPSKEAATKRLGHRRNPLLRNARTEQLRLNANNENA